MTTPPPSGSTDMLEILALEALDDALFRNRVNDPNLSGVLYGGQVLSQALHAAMLTVGDRPVHSLHGYFLRRGDSERPVLYHVERTRDGGRFSTRRVTAVQHEATIFHMAASFHEGDPGFDHQAAPRPSVPPPEDLMDLGQIAERYGDQMDDSVRRRLSAYTTVEVRPTDPVSQLLRADSSARGAFWIRIPSLAGASAALSACGLAYASDSWLAPAARMPHGPSISLEGYQVASLDHAMWFHAPARADQWHLYEVESPWTGSGRGLARGAIYDRQGRIVASAAQEVMMRRPPTPGSK